MATMNRESPLRRHRDERPFSKIHYLLLFVAIVVGLGYLLAPAPTGTPLKYGELIELLHDPESTFRDVQVAPSRITGTVTRPRAQPLAFYTTRAGLEQDPDLVPLLREKVGSGLQGIPDESPFRRHLDVVMQPLALVLFGSCLFFIFRMLGERGPGSFSRSKVRLHSQDGRGCTFRDVAGIDEAVDELREVVDFLQHPDKYRAVGGRIPKGILLVGPPGTGKTLLARAVAGEAGVPFFSISGSEFVELFVGVGAARVRDLFAQTKAHAPCIVFIDELDALGKARGSRGTNSHDEREQTLNQLLVEMDGFDSGSCILVMAATNRPEMLDSALLRPGRFDRTLVVDRPDVNGREAILHVHARKVKMCESVRLRDVAALTAGCVGADLANIINEAALLAARRGRQQVEPGDLDEAIERGIAGLERKKRVLSPRERERIAYHECGHALVATVLPNTDPVHKISIIPRGAGALGYTLQLPGDDRYLVTQSELLSQVQVLLGGVVAEELVFHETSTGAQNDLERATRIARSMVKQFGMSRLGRVSYQGQNTSPFLAASGPTVAPPEREYSEQVAQEIDREVCRIIDAAAQDVRDILTQRREALEAVSAVLMEQEVLDGIQFKTLLSEHLNGPRLVPQSLAVDSARPASSEPAAAPAGHRPRLVPGSGRR